MARSVSSLVGTYQPRPWPPLFLTMRTSYWRGRQWLTIMCTQTHRFTKDCPGLFRSLTRPAMVHTTGLEDLGDGREDQCDAGDGLLLQPPSSRRPSSSRRPPFPCRERTAEIPSLLLMLTVDAPKAVDLESLN